MDPILNCARDALRLCADDPQVGIARIPRLPKRRQLDVADLLEPELARHALDVPGRDA
jgi:hypothetical protein